jgi:ABC-type multidrug transport system permease subunit
MMRLRVVRAVAATTFREFWRSKDAVFWTYGFPILMAIVLGFAFQPKPLPPVPVALIADGGAPAVLAALAAEPRLSLRTLSPAAADAALARGVVDLVVRFDAGQPVLRGHPMRSEAELATLLVERALAADARLRPPIAQEVEDRPGARYIDFLIPGLIGLNLLGAGMWGVGFNLVQLRTQHLLRRLSVAPMLRSEFLLGYLFGRFVLVIPEAAAILLFGVLLWDVPLRGSLLALSLLVVIGGFAFAALGFLLAARAKTIEGIGGLMNLFQLPMWLLGGVYFDVDRLDGVVRRFAELLPLLHLNRALRAVMLGPADVGDVTWPLLGLGAFAVLCFCAGLRWFRWL